MDRQGKGWDRGWDRGLGDFIRQRAAGRGWDELMAGRKVWEWGWDDAAKRVVHEVVKRRQFGPLGTHALPGKLDIRLLVANGSAATVRRFVEDPTFIDQIHADLLNRLDGMPRHGLPALTFEVVDAEEDAIELIEQAAALPTVLRLRSHDESADGTSVLWDERDYLLRGAQPTFTIGRGPWHGSTDLVPNDIQLPIAARFVSRRAATLRRVGGLLQVSARDQGRFMVVKWRDHEMRPERAAKDAVEVGVGGTLVFRGADTDERLYLEVLAASTVIPEPAQE